MRHVCLGPPVAHASLFVKGSAFAVKCVADLVADHRTNSTVVYGVRSFGIIERWLQDGRWEIEGILQWQIHRVHRLRGHRPLFSIHVRSKPADLPVVLKQIAAPDIAENVIRLYFIARVLMPVFRITDTNVESIELGLGFRLGLRSHPWKGINALPKRFNNVGHEGLGPGFGLRGEVSLRVNLSYRVAQELINKKHASLPTGTLLRRTEKNFAKEIEAFLSQGFGQKIRVVLNQMIGKPVLPGVKRDRSDKRGLAGKCRWLPDGEFFLLLESCAAKILSPVQTRSLGCEV